MNKNGQFEVIPTLQAAFIMIIMLIGFFFVVKIIGGEVRQTVKSVETSYGKLFLLNALRQEIPIEKIEQIGYLKNGDKIIDFIGKFNGDNDDFKLVFGGILDQYKPKRSEKPYVDFTFLYRFSLVKDVENYNENLLASQDSIYGVENICENYVKLQDELYLCLRYLLNV